MTPAATLTPFQRNVLSAIKALGRKATRGAIADRLKKPLGTVSAVLFVLLRKKVVTADDSDLATRVWRVVKARTAPQWRPEAGSEDAIFGENPRMTSGRKRKKKTAKARR